MKCVEERKGLRVIKGRERWRGEERKDEKEDDRKREKKME